MLKISICDDDNNYLNELKKYIADFSNQNDITVDITLIDESSSIIDNEIYKHDDIIILDIDMPDFSGIEIASKINLLKGNSDKPYIIFVTNRDGLVFEALKEQPYSFVRKTHIEDLIPCLLSLYKKLNAKDIYIIKSGKMHDRIPIKSIMYLEKQKNYVVFHTELGDYKDRTTIDQKAADLTKYNFIRPHIGYLINNKYIDKILTASVRLLDGTEIPLSKKYRKDFKQNFYDWIVNQQ